MIIPSNLDRHLVFINEQGKQVPFKIVGFDVDDKGKLTPICYPTPPKGAPLFAVESGGFRKFDLATGIATGQATIQPEV
jgi:hypothetical protein